MPTSTKGPNYMIWNQFNYFADTPSTGLSEIPFVVLQNWRRSCCWGRVPCSTNKYRVASSSHQRLKGTAFSNCSKVTFGATIYYTTFSTLWLNVSSWATALVVSAWGTQAEEGWLMTIFMDHSTKIGLVIS